MRRGPNGIGNQTSSIREGFFKSPFLTKPKPSFIEQKDLSDRQGAVIFGYEFYFQNGQSWDFYDGKQSIATDLPPSSMKITQVDVKFTIC